MRILFIHGRSQEGLDEIKLKNTWITTLKKGLEKNGLTLPHNTKFVFPYYGDVLDEWRKTYDLPESAKVLKKGDYKDDEYEAFIYSVANEIRKNKGISNQEILSSMPKGAVQQKSVQNWDWVHAIVKIIDGMFTPLANWTIEAFLKDIFLYLHKPAVTKSIHKIIAEKITKEPTLIVSHSLGTVIAYRMLNENPDLINVAGFITIGSPLGIKAINEDLGTFTNVSIGDKWFNAFDDNDIVALHPLDEQNFKTDPPIKNYSGVDNHTDNQHGIIGYLDDKVISRKIKEYLS